MLASAKATLKEGERGTQEESKSVIRTTRVIAPGTSVIRILDRSRNGPRRQYPDPDKSLIRFNFADVWWDQKEAWDICWNGRYEIVPQRNLTKGVATLITQVMVDPRDPALKTPASRSDPFYSIEQLR